MPLISLRTLLDHAQLHNYGVPSFNFNSMEQLQAVMAAADSEGSPVIVQVSSGGRKYATEMMVKNMMEAMIALYPHLPIVWHQDHAHTPEECFSSLRSGYSSVMMDGSLSPTGQVQSLEDNIALTRRVVDVAHPLGVSVEGEIGCLGRVEHDGTKSAYMTDVDEAVRFIRETQVDALAIAIGTSHGAYKFDTMPTDQVLALSRLQELHEALPHVHFVLHGSSSIPQEYLEMIRHYGGDVPETFGVPVEDMVKAVRLGVRKFNIDTDLRIIAIAIMREFLVCAPRELDPRKIHKKIIITQQDLIADRYNKLGSSGHAASLMAQLKFSDICLL